METFSKCSAMTTLTMAITIIFSVIFIVIIISLVRSVAVGHYSMGIKIVQGTTAALLSVLLLATAAHTPRKVSVSEDEIKVHLLCRNIHIPAQEVDSVGYYPYGIPSFRVCGSGNFWGNLGIFNSELCGTYYSFCTASSNVCLIYRRNKRPIAVSVANPDIFLPFRKEQ